MATNNLSNGMCYLPTMLMTSDKLEAQTMDGIVWEPAYASHEVFQHKYNNGMHQCTKQATMRVVKSIQVGIDFHFPAQLHLQANAVFLSPLRMSNKQAQGLLDAQTPLFNQINGGGM